MGARRPALDRAAPRSAGNRRAWRRAMPLAVPGNGMRGLGYESGKIVRPAKPGPAGRLSWALAPAPTISISRLPTSLELSIPISIPDTIGTLRQSTDPKPLCFQHIFWRDHHRPLPR
jgi:hypothetical protein